MSNEALLEGPQSAIDLDRMDEGTPFEKKAAAPRKEYFGRYKGALDAEGVPEYLDLAAIRHRLNNVQPRQIETHLGIIPMSDHFTLMPAKDFVARLNMMIDALICDARQAHGVREAGKVAAQLKAGVPAEEVKIEQYIKAKRNFWFVER